MDDERIHGTKEDGRRALGTLVVTLQTQHDWIAIAAAIPNRTFLQCKSRWEKGRAAKNKKQYWSLHEDQTLHALVTSPSHHGDWAKIAAALTAATSISRRGKQCRERWYNHLSPDLNTYPCHKPLRKDWTLAEEVLLLEAIQKYGTKWALLAKLVPGRCENSLKNKFHTLEKKAALLQSERNKVANLQEAFVAPGLSVDKSQGWIEGLLTEKKREQASEGTTMASEARLPPASSPAVANLDRNEELKACFPVPKPELTWLENPSLAEASADANVDVDVDVDVNLDVDVDVDVRAKIRRNIAPAQDADAINLEISANLPWYDTSSWLAPTRRN